MNNIKSLIAALAFAGLTACADNSPKTFSGFITDASMNTVTVRALTDESTCTFATTDADKSDANSLLLGAPVTVDYTGKLKDGTAATKIATDPTYAEAVGKWTMPDPIAPEGVMGVEIMVEGAARSINMATLVYTSWELQGEADKILCLPGFDCDAEFGVDLAGGDGFIGVRVDARRQTQQHLLPDAPAFCLAADDFQFLRMVGDKIADVCCHRVGNVGVGFVVAVEEGALHLETCALCRRNLARGDDVDRHALVLHDGVDALEAGGFAGVERKAQGPEPRQRPDHRLHQTDGHDRQNGRRELHPHDEGTGTVYSPRPSSKQLFRPESQRLGLPGALFVPEVRRPFFPENSGSELRRFKSVNLWGY